MCCSLSGSAEAASGSSSNINSLEDRLDLFLDRARDYFNDRWGDAWLRKDGNSYVAHVGVVDGKSADERTLRRLTPRGIRPRMVVVRFSYREVGDFARSADRIVSEYANQVYGEISYVPQHNGIEVVLETRVKSLVRKLRNRIPRAALRIKIDELPVYELLDETGKLETPRSTDRNIPAHALWPMLWVPMLLVLVCIAWWRHRIHRVA